MYKVVVVDDERRIRDGIAKLVKLSEIGIEVVACLKDGNEAIEFLEKNNADIVITDIRMVHISGLELAKYIHENMPQIKVVIISGYKEFEYAQQAISYNVKNYLIKPTNPKELKAILLGIKKELDELNSQKMRDKMYNELIPVLKEEFISDIFVGGLSDENKIKNKIEIFNLDPDIYTMPCLLIEVNFANREEEKNWEYGKEGMENFITNVFYNEYDDFSVFKVAFNSCYNNYLVISKKIKDENEFSRKALTSFEDIKKQMLEMTKTIWNIKICASYKSLYEAKSKAFNTGNASFVEKIKILHSHIVGNQQDEAIGIFNSMISFVSETGKLKELLIEIFDHLFEMLRGESYIFNDNEKFNYQKIMKYESYDDVLNYSKSIIDIVINSFLDSEDDNVGQILAIAQKYIEENYAKDISLSDVAARTYLSPVYLSKFFKKHMNENFSDYLVRVRMTHAVEFLKKKYKIEDVSRLSGYNSSNYFHRIFKGYYGLSPKDWARKNLR